MAIELEPYYKSTWPGHRFNILLLSDGFTAENEFKMFCEILTQKLIQIPPFKVCREMINIFLHFHPSQKDGIDDDGQDTNYGTHFLGDSLVCSDSDKIRDFVQSVEIKLKDLQRNLPGSYVLMARNQNSFGAMGVVAKSDTPAGNQGVFQYGIYNVPYFVFTTHGFKISSPDEVDGYQYTFAHELAHSIRGYTESPTVQITAGRVGLDEEYELSGNDYRKYPDADSEPLSPNVTKVKTVEAGSQIDINPVKWKELIPESKRSYIVNKDPAHVIYKQTTDQPDRTWYHDPTVFQGFDKEAVMLVEGGYSYRSGIFRPNLYCNMRSVIEVHTEADGSTTVRHPKANFCKVCSNHILRVIAGLSQYVVGAPLPPKVQEAINTESLLYKNMMSRLVTSLENSVNLGTGQLEELDLFRHCGTSTARLAIMIDQTNIKLHMMRFGIASSHTYLKYRNIIMDPTFYQLYLNIDDSSRFSYIYQGAEYDIPPDGNSASPHGFRFNDGFIGSIEQLREHIWTYMPLATRWVQPGSHTPLVQMFDDRDLILDPLYDTPGYKLNMSDFSVKFDKTPGWSEQNLANVIQHQLQAFYDYRRILSTGGNQWDGAPSWSNIRAMFDPLNFNL